MSGLMQPGPSVFESLRRKKEKEGLMSAMADPVVDYLDLIPLLPAQVASGLLRSAPYLTGERDLGEGLSGLATMTGLMQAMRVPPIIRNAIRVFHGSPHKYEKVDSSKIGTGEGGQAYGYGLNWAEHPETAKKYKELLEGANYAYKGGVPIKDDKLLTRAIEAKHSGKDPEKFLEHMYSMNPWDKDWIEAKKKLPDAMAMKDTSYGPHEGSLYEASLRWPDAAREAKDPLSAKHFLDWSKPMSQQAKPIKDAWLATKADLPANAAADLGGNMDLLYGKNVMPDDFLGTMTAIGGRKDFGERALASRGVPGVTYLDAGSRAAGQGTRNYVTFDDALVELLKRNGGLIK